MSDFQTYRVEKPVVVYVSVSATGSRNVTPIRLSPGTLLSTDGRELRIVRNQQTIKAAFNSPDEQSFGSGLLDVIQQKVASGELSPVDSPNAGVNAAAESLVTKLLAIQP